MPATSEDIPHRIGPSVGAGSTLFDRRRAVASRAEIAALGAYFCLYLSWQAFRWLPGDQAFVGDLFFLPIGVAAIALSWRASRACEPVKRLRRFWRLFALALCAQVTGDAAMAIYDSLPGAEIPFPSLADPPYLAFYLLMGMALIQVPVAPTTRGQRQRIGLDLAAAIIGGGMVIWYLVLAPTIVAGGYTTFQLATSIAYPLGDVAILATLAIVLLTWSPPALRRPLGFIVAGLSMFVVADIAYGHALLHDGYTAGGPIDILWIGALTLFAVAAGRQEKVGADAPAASVPERAPIERRVSWLPFGALALGSATLLAAEWGRPFVADFSIVLTAIALAALIAVRQYVTQRQMIQLQLELGAARDELSDLADHDSLTGLSNRRRIDEDLSREMERAKRYGHRLSVLFLDIDRFKSINDEYGHAVGDAALSEFASLLRDCLRPADLPSRWGGEEFVVILPETGSEEARRTAERIRATAAAHDFSFDETTGLTCSIGVSTFPDGAAEIDTLLKLSDGALLKAKRDGRNRVAVA